MAAFRTSPILCAARMVATLALIAAGSARAANVLLVTNNSSPSTEETFRSIQFLAWGHSVTTIQDSASSSAFDTAVAAADVVYVPYGVDISDEDEDGLYNKLRTVIKGVVHEGIPNYDDNMGWTSTNGSSSQCCSTSFDIDDNSHAVTTGLSTGSVTIYNSSSSAWTSPVIGTVTSGATVLGSRSSGSDELLLVADTGATLANTVSSNSTAAGKRVRLPFGGSTFSWSNLSSDGLTIVQQAIEWAALFGGTGGIEVYVSTVDGSTLQGLTLENEDVAHYDPTTATATLEFEGDAVFSSDVDVDGYHILASGNVLLSTSTSATIGALSFADEDVVEYNPTSGTATMYFDGSAVFSSDEDVDAVSISTSGDLVLSTRDNAAIGALSFADEDLVEYDVGAGTATLLLDASAVGMSADINAAHIESDGKILLSTETSATLGSVSFGDDDIVRYDPGSDTSELVFDGGTLFSSSLEDIDAIANVGAAAPPASGLVGRWRFDETSGTTAADSSGNGFDGTYEDGPVLGVAGVRATAARFNSADSDDYVSLPNTVLDGAATVSVAWWMKTTKTGNQAVLSGANASQSNEFLLFFSSATNLRAQVGSGIANHSIDSIADGRWRHFVYQIDRAAGIERVYINGVLVIDTTRSVTSDTLDIEEDGLVIGQEQDSVGGDFNTAQVFAGDLDDLVIYNEMITEDTIAELYGLVGHWRLDERNGTVAEDSSDQENDGSFSNSPTLGQTGVRGFATEFDGSSEYIDIPASESLDTVDVSIAAWVYLPTLPSGYATILEHGRETNNWYGLWKGGNGDLLHFRWANYGSNTYIDSATPLRAGRWTQVVGTYDSVTNEARLYVDGQLDTTVASGVTPSVVSSAVRIGVHGANDEYFPGSIDDVVVYNRVMLPEEIAEHYGLMGHWKLDETSGVTASDSSFFDNSGAAVGTPTWGSAIRGNGVEFNGSNKIEINDLMGQPRNFSVACWANIDSSNTANATLVTIGDHVRLRGEYAGAPRVEFKTGSSTWFTAGTQSYVGAGWRHYVTTFDDQHNALKLYVDGQLVNATYPSIEAVSWVGAGNDTVLGGREDGQTAFYLTGAMDDVRIYNRAITEQEIAELYGLVAWYRLEETTGVAASDSTAIGADGAFTGSASWSADSREGTGSLELDGADYVEVPSLLVNDTTDGVAISGWAKLTSADSQGAELFSIGDAFAIRLDDPNASSGASAFAYHGSGWNFLSTGLFVEGAGWRHFVASYDASDLSVKLYVDGVLQATTTMSAPIDLDGVGSVTRIGTHANGETTRDFTGNVDDLRVYNRAVTAEEARTLFLGDYVPGLRIVRWEEAANP